MPGIFMRQPIANPAGLNNLAMPLESIKALLASVDAGLEDVARAAIWLTDTAHFAAFNTVYAEYFPQTPPARSAVCSA